ncbi:MAG: PTS glucose transporter subunit IIA [Opitutaceae bacterium]|nr:PTS glucose transporter subunit IIA [Opitutaceae bacterium]|tara:strand:- start:581 stop:1057 length:477 start_codon:yes stop_codon:yes gene_type:complete
MAGRISNLLDLSRINLQVQSPDRTAALEEVARQLEDHPDVTNFAEFYARLLAREELDTTYLGNGIALPHARTQHVNKIVMAVGRSENGISFKDSNEDVKLMFVLGTTKSNPTDYLMCVSSLVKILNKPENLEALMTAATPEEFIQAINTAEEKLLCPA